MLGRRDEHDNCKIIVRGWWPRFRGNPNGLGSAQISIDKRWGAYITGLGRRRRVFHVPAGEYRVMISVSAAGKVDEVFDDVVIANPERAVRIQVVGGYRRLMFGHRIEPSAWQLPGYRLPTDGTTPEVMTAERNAVPLSGMGLRARRRLPP